MPHADPSITVTLLDWYGRHGRALPWRMPPGADAPPPDPYRVWLSEIMLQQTTVAAVKPYYERFVNAWPTVADLAAAEPAAVMSAWAGLGYYARARNMLACAKAVVGEHGGRFPPNAAMLRELPGIGDYTSAAVAAIAFGEAVAVVDGNVERVVTRLFAIEAPLPGARASIRRHVAALVPPDRAGDFAQATMDLGATICTPKSPACVICPVAAPCAARAEGRQTLFPVKPQRARKPLRRGAAFVALRPHDGAIWLRRRPEGGLLGGMSEPPTTGWSARADGAVDASEAPVAAAWASIGSVSHGFTHFDLELTVWRAEVAADPPGEGWWSPPAALAHEALPTLMRKVVRLARPEPALASG
ncbi:A/G-specific adenine glycosylase [Aurantimonas sp. MSK8Z-1]|uniref:A/G-specific adenine glycosylase n=1 Tax=Mangrovibrevibacter kandeliae TaxID=2968473 RepID=UPI002119B4D4|nr:A/G-specific adenine glycosylase [Aurantimonas sp. MSK8Z-1]MCW4113529.1 A/G-specific adenine glycosylase [Aurantimonas sp. MSK8Z-1]